VTSLRISEIFFSLQGEAKTVGIPTVFIRLTGCPLRCAYCDTEYAFSGGVMKSIDDILSEVASFTEVYYRYRWGASRSEKLYRAFEATLQ
jgi:7-carboxy-7-deazaguanine synthase